MFAGFGFTGGSETVVNGAVEWGWECLSALKGVLISRMGLRCRDNLCLAERGVARAAGGVRGCSPRQMEGRNAATVEDDVLGEIMKGAGCLSWTSMPYS